MARRVKTDAMVQPQGPVPIDIPHLWNPRSYQLEVMRAMPANAGTTPHLTRKLLMLKWHRRAGKDLTGLAMTLREMATRPGLYWHLLPTFRQAKSILWDGSDRKGIAFMDRFPKELIKTKNETELLVELNPFPGQPSGSRWQARGTDDINSLRGANPIGVVLSEFSEMQENIWPEIIQPILVENGGWALFIFTPKGKNHSYKLFQVAKQHPETWFSQALTVDDTRRDAKGEEGNPCVPPEEIEQMRQQGVAEEIIQQEYYVSDDGFLRGTIFGDLITSARKDGRITRVPYNTSYPVGTCWDIGRTDSTAIWFYQRIGQQICFIDYLEDSRKGADEYAKKLREKPYIITKLILPHDARVKGFTASHSTEEYFQRVFRGVTVAERTSVQSGVDMTRRMFSRFVFDESKCGRGIECLENYRRKWDEEKHDYSGEPIHSEFSHGADAMRTGVVGGLDTPLDWQNDLLKRNPQQAETEFSVFGVN